jgi:hypothetical protein
MWFPTPGQLGFGVKAAQEIYKALDKNLVSELYDAALHGPPTFLLFGPGGDGKSTLKTYLTTLSEDTLDPTYEMSQVWEHDGKLKGRRFSNVTAFPGQPAYRDEQIVAHRKWLQRLRRPFIVLCLCYGHRSIDPQQAASRDAPQMSEEARHEELIYAKDALAKINDVCGLPHYNIFSIILKQDLWWDARKEVDDFYTQEYAQVIDSFAENAVGKNNVRHYMYPMCLIRSNLRDRYGNVIKEGCSTYDETIRREQTQYFLRQLRTILLGAQP